MDEGQKRRELALVLHGAAETVETHAALLAVGVAFPIRGLQVAVHQANVLTGGVDEGAVIERPLLAAVNFGEQGGAAQQAAEEQVKRKLARGLVFVQNARGGDELQRETRGIWRRGFGHEVAELPGGESAFQGFGAAEVNFVLREVVGDAFELITALAAAEAGAAQLVEGINEVRHKLDALADEGQLEGERFAGVDDFALVERRQEHKGMRQISGGDVGVGAAVLRRLKDVGIGALVAKLAALAALSWRQDAADFFHDVPKPAAQGGAFVFRQVQRLPRGEVKGEAGEGELEVLQGGGEVGHGGCGKRFSVIS